MSEPPILTVTDMSFGYGARLLFERLSLEARGGEIVGILGPNGAGKTTLIKCLVGIERPHGGTVVFNQEDISRLPVWRRARMGMAYLSQSTSLMPDMNILDNIALGNGGRTPKIIATQVLHTIGLEAHADHKPDQLSGGQRRLAELGRLFASDARLLILDEPFAMLDPKTRAKITELLQLFNTQGRTIIMTDHDVLSTLNVVHRALVLIDGKICCEGNPAKILQDTFVRAHYLGERIDLM